MNLSGPYPIEKTLRLFIFLTTFEMSVAGIFLFRARSLTADAGYSLPRLALLVVWLIGFVFCVSALASALKGSWLFQRIRIGLEILLRSETQFAHVWGWLIVLIVISWGAVALFHFMPEFLEFLWSSLPVLMEQYLVVVFVFGVFAAQCVLLMWRLNPQGVVVLNGFGSTAATAILLFLFALFVYASTAIHLDLATRSRTTYFPELAQAFLQGRLDLPNPPATKDLTLFAGKYYVSFPPLGALLMLPSVAWRGVDSINTLLFNAIFAALGVMCTFLMLETIKKLGWSQLRWWENALLALFLGFGTAQYYLSTRLLVNLISHILTTAFLALSLWLAFASVHRSPQIVIFLSGSALGLAMLARPNVVFAWVVLVAIQLQGLRESGAFTGRRFVRQVIALTIPIFVVMLGLFWYNLVRFGAPLDFGYTYMLLKDPSDLVMYGQFHPHFILENLYDNFFRLPYWESACRMFAPNPQGTSIFLTSPVVLYLFLAWKKEIWVQGAWLSIGLIALCHALYYNSGAIQFGYRFSLDFMPIVIALLAFGFRKKLSNLSIGLIVLSMLVNYIGVLWMTHRWCVNF